MTQDLAETDAPRAPRWHAEAHVDLLDSARRDFWRAYRHVFEQAFEEGSSIKRAARQLTGNQVFFLVGISSDSLKNVGRFFDERQADLTPQLELRAIEDEGFDLVYRAVDGYSVLPSTPDALRRLACLQIKLGEATQYAAGVAFDIVSQQNPRTARVVQSVSRGSWIEASIELERTGEREKALDVIFDRLDDLLVAAKDDRSKFRECDAAISDVPVERMSNAQLLTVLTATAGAKDELPSRRSFYERAKAVIQSRGADANRLLVGLE